MAKKSKAKINKSAEIRKYLAAHPDVTLAAAATALQKKGVKVTPGYISVIKSSAKKQAAKKTPAKQSGRASKVAAASAVSFDSLLMAKQLARELGGIENAKRALDALEELTA